MGYKAPTPPDYTQAALAGQAADQRAQDTATAANRPNVNTPWGQQTWTNEPGANGMPNWTQNISLNPADQKALESQQAIRQGTSDIAQNKLGQVGAALGSAPDYSNLTGWGQVPQGGQGMPVAGQGIPQGGQGLPTAGEGIQKAFDFSSAPKAFDPMAANEAGFNASYGQMQSRLDPRFAQAEENTRSKLYNMGLKEGDTAFDQGMANFARDKNDAYSSAMNQSVLTGGQLGNQLFQQGMAGRQQGVGEATAQGQFGNAAQQQGFGQGMQTQGTDFQQRMAAQGQGFGQGMQTQGQDFAQQMQAQQGQDAQRQNQFSQQAQMRGQSLNELMALLSGQQVGMPGGMQQGPASTAGAAQGANLLGAAQGQFGSAMDQYNAKNQQLQGYLQAGASLAGGAGSMFGF